MRFYIFKSEVTRELRAFAGDVSGRNCPIDMRHGRRPASLPPKQPPPHKLSRDAIEEAIGSEGFQLFRLKTTHA